MPMTGRHLKARPRFPGIAELDPSWQTSSGLFPVVPESALKATLGILDRTVRRRATKP
jgi:hypothetical protein